MLNQIYLDPSVQFQKEHLGTRLMEATLPLMAQKGYDSLIVEYNINNKNAARFYKKLDITPIGKTQDLDHILPEPFGMQISQVEIGHAPIEKIVRACERKMSQNHLSRLPFSKEITR